MIIRNYTIHTYSAKSGTVTQVPGTGKMTSKEANYMARDIRLNNLGRIQVAVYRGNEMCSCFGMSENMKPMITI